MYDTTKPYTDTVMNLIRQTWHTSHCDVQDGNYPTIIMKDNSPTIDHTDGIGTKGHYHWNTKSFRNAAIDAFAMNANDLFMYGATPCKMQNHIFLPEDNHEAIYDIVDGLVDLSMEYDIAMTGGETSIHMNMNGMDISVTMTGIAHKTPKENRYKANDILIGLPSAGLHSNGFTMVHNRLGGFCEEYTKPTRIYSEIAQIYDKVTALNHITGGAYTKLKPNLIGVDAEFHFKEKPQEIFRDLFGRAGIMSEDMYKTFNCGYGFILGVPEENVPYVLEKTDGVVVGKVIEGHGRVFIQSAFDNKLVRY